MLTSQPLVVSPFGHWDVLRVPASPVASLVPAHEQLCSSVEIEDEQHPHLAATAGARPQLLEVVCLRALGAIDERSTERGSQVGQHINRRRDLVVGVVVETEDPVLYIGEQHDVPGHYHNIG